MRSPRNEGPRRELAIHIAMAIVVVSLVVGACFLLFGCALKDGQHWDCQGTGDHTEQERPQDGPGGAD